MDRYLLKPQSADRRAEVLVVHARGSQPECLVELDVQKVSAGHKDWNWQQLLKGVEKGLSKTPFLWA